MYICRSVSSTRSNKCTACLYFYFMDAYSFETSVLFHLMNISSFNKNAKTWKYSQTVHTLEDFLIKHDKCTTFFPPIHPSPSLTQTHTQPRFMLLPVKLSPSLTAVTRSPILSLWSVTVQMRIIRESRSRLISGIMNWARARACACAVYFWARARTPAPSDVRLRINLTPSCHSVSLSSARLACQGGIIYLVCEADAL